MQFINYLNDIVNENGSVKDYVDNVLIKSLKKEKIEPIVKKEVGYIKYIFDNGYSIVNDGVGIEVKDKSDKEIEYFDTPKLDYKKAIDLVLKKLNESEEINESAESMFGMSREELIKMIDDARSKKYLAMGILSDVQEMINDRKIEQKLNIVKYIIDHNISK